jgi:hypothetical protein
MAQRQTPEWMEEGTLNIIATFTRCNSYVRFSWDQNVMYAIDHRKRSDMPDTDSIKGV